MSNQYFDNNLELAHQEKMIKFSVGNKHLELETDNGVFSKNQVDFGSKVLIETFIKTINTSVQGMAVELGSGYGPISLAIANEYPNINVIGIEVNQRAFLLSQKNANKNKIDNVQFIEGDAIDVQIDSLSDFVITNPPIRAGKAVVHAFVEKAFGLLKKDGQLWVVIQKKQGAPSMEKRMDELFGNVEKMTQEKGYWILRSIK